MRTFSKILGDFAISKDEPVTVKECGNIVEIIFASRRNHKAQILRVDKDHYIRLKDETGELLEVQHAESRIDDTGSVKRSLEKLRDYINTNATEPKNCRFLTLTYAKNMTRTQKANKRFSRF